MIHRQICTLGAAAAFLAVAATAPATLYSASAFDNGTITGTGPRTNPNNQRFFNAENGGGTFGSFAVADFNVSDFHIGGAVAGVSSFKLTLIESDAAFSAPGSLQFWLTGDTTTSIDAGSAALKFDGTHLPGGVGSQLAPLVLLGSGAFTTTGNTNTGQADVYNFTLSAAAQTMLVNSLNTTGGKLRVVVTPNDGVVAATYAGFANTTLAGPQISLNATAVPEPATIATLLVGAFALIGRRRRR